MVYGQFNYEQIYNRTRARGKRVHFKQVTETDV